MCIPSIYNRYARYSLIPCVMYITPFLRCFYMHVTTIEQNTDLTFLQQDWYATTSRDITQNADCLQLTGMVTSIPCMMLDYVRFTFG